jgi:hypothetical protein
VRFRGRLRGKRLKPGRYRFVIRARDGAGNVSKPSARRSGSSCQPSSGSVANARRALMAGTK